MNFKFFFVWSNSSSSTSHCASIIVKVIWEVSSSSSTFCNVSSFLESVPLTPFHDQVCFVMMELVSELMMDYMLEWNNLNPFREDLWHPMVDDFCDLFWRLDACCSISWRWIRVVVKVDGFLFLQDGIWYHLSWGWISSNWEKMAKNP